MKIKKPIKKKLRQDLRPKVVTLKGIINYTKNILQWLNIMVSMLRIGGCI